LLSYADFDGRDDLLGQVDEALVVGDCGCGCATINLHVTSAPVTDSVGYPVPNEATVLGASSEGIGGVLVFAKDGYLTSPWVYDFAGEPISAFPPQERLEFHLGTPLRP